MGYCLNLYCTGLSQDNHWKYITLAQIGLDLVKSLVILQLIFIITKRKKRSNAQDTKINLISSSQWITHPVLQVWVHMASLTRIFIWTLYIFSSSFSEPAIDCFHSPYKVNCIPKTFSDKLHQILLVWVFLVLLKEQIQQNFTTMYKKLE